MGKTKTAFVGGDESKNEKKHERAHRGEEEKVHISGLKGGQRVKMVEIAPEEAEKIESEQVEEGKSTKKAAEKIRSKKYVEAKSKFDHQKLFKIKDAVKTIKEASYSKFDGTMELHLVVKKIGTNAQVSLPHQAGKEKKVEIATDKTVEKLKEGKIDFDVLVATPDMMPKIVPFARLLGPKGLMPNPKNGTLIADAKKISAFSTSSINLRTEKEAPLIHTVVGKVSQKDEEIIDNIEAILKVLGGGKQIVRAFLKSTMSPSIKLQLN